MTTADQIAAFIARKGVTKCPPAKVGARSLSALRRAHEAALTEGSDEEPSAEQRAEREREAFGRARGAGFSVSDALDEAREAGG
jgi:hypothetical protein